MKIELGGGENPRQGFKNVDIRKSNKVDYVCDLEKESLPFKKNSISEIYSHHTFEHLNNIIPIMNECWRVMEWGAKLTIIVPHKDCDLAWQDPTHKRWFVEESMKHFCGDYLKKYSLDYSIRCCFKLLKNEVTVPDGRPDYLKQIEFVLEKDIAHLKEVNYNLFSENSEEESSREEQFRKVTKNLRDIFLKKNNEYGDAYFSDAYSDSERWLSIQRKIVRLSNQYKGEISMSHETLKDTWEDLANYCIMELMILRERK